MEGVQPALTSSDAAAGVRVPATHGVAVGAVSVGLVLLQSSLPVTAQQMLVNVAPAGAVLLCFVHLLLQQRQFVLLHLPVTPPKESKSFIILRNFFIIKHFVDC